MNDVNPSTAEPGKLEQPRPDLLRLLGARDRALEFEAESQAPNTRRAYESDWAAFETWCAEVGANALPASWELLAMYVSEKASIQTVSGGWMYAPSTISRWVTAINGRHAIEGLQRPGSDRRFQAVLAGIRRDHARPTRRMAPLLLAELRQIVAAIDMAGYPAGVIGVRDQAILVMGFAGAFRRSELAALRIDDVSRHPEDGLHVRVQRSKTDQEGEGRVKGLPYGANPATCPPCAWARWLRVLAASPSRAAVMAVLRATTLDEHVCRGPLPQLPEAIDATGHLFRRMVKGGTVTDQPMSGHAVNEMLKRRVTAASLDATRFGGHSMRAGFVTQALRAGASTSEVMRQTFHRDPAMVEVYAREYDPLKGNAVTRLGL
ncbi:tyrosine-type recombinase/integrase [Agromyces subbeticus]|uniref:tyrosine-type recombinase/integrase n=1 Tax=Agromyces subbeticus TaxID=293890 RepID=UPI0003B3720E|nr:tyrosine-type recombinase/integrase [Agromyces subbeticus]